MDVNSRGDTRVLEIRDQRLIVCVVLLDILGLSDQFLESLANSIIRILSRVSHPQSQHCLNCQMRGHLKETQLVSAVVAELHGSCSVEIDRQISSRGRRSRLIR